MSEYCLVFLGEIIESFQLDTVKENFKKHFNLSEIQIKYIFSGKEIILKKALSQQEALNYALRIDEMGGVSYIDPMDSDAHLPEDIPENRRLQKRRWRNVRRNHTRAGINSDRRVHKERRKNVD